MYGKDKYELKNGIFFSQKQGGFADLKQTHTAYTDKFHHNKSLAY